MANKKSFENIRNIETLKRSTSFDIASVLKDAVGSYKWQQKDGLWSLISAGMTDYSSQMFERINDYTKNMIDIDTCQPLALKSIAKSVNLQHITDFIRFTYPNFIQNLINTFSIDYKLLLNPPIMKYKVKDNTDVSNLVLLSPGKFLSNNAVSRFFGSIDQRNRTTFPTETGYSILYYMQILTNLDDLKYLLETVNGINLATCAWDYIQQQNKLEIHTFDTQYLFLHNLSKQESPSLQQIFDELYFYKNLTTDSIIPNTVDEFYDKEFSTEIKAIINYYNATLGKEITYELKKTTILDHCTKIYKAKDFSKYKEYYKTYGTTQNNHLQSILFYWPAYDAEIVNNPNNYLLVNDYKFDTNTTIINPFLVLIAILKNIVFNAQQQKLLIMQYTDETSNIDIDLTNICLHAVETIQNNEVSYYYSLIVFHFYGILYDNIFNDYLKSQWQVRQTETKTFVNYVGTFSEYTKEEFISLVKNYMSDKELTEFLKNGPAVYNQYHVDFIQSISIINGIRAYATADNDTVLSYYIPYYNNNLDLFKHDSYLYDNKYYKYRQLLLGISYDFCSCKEPEISTVNKFVCKKCGKLLDIEENYQYFEYNISDSYLYKAALIFADYCMKIKDIRTTIKSIVQQYSRIGTSKLLIDLISQYFYKQFTQRNSWQLHDTASQTYDALSTFNLFLEISDLQYSTIDNFDVELIQYYDKTSYLNIYASSLISSFSIDLSTTVTGCNILTTDFILSTVQYIEIPASSVNIPTSSYVELSTYILNNCTYVETQSDLISNTYTIKDNQYIYNAQSSYAISGNYSFLSSNFVLNEDQIVSSILTSKTWNSPTTGYISQGQSSGIFTSDKLYLSGVVYKVYSTAVSSINLAQPKINILTSLHTGYKYCDPLYSSSYVSTVVWQPDYYTNYNSNMPFWDTVSSNTFENISDDLILQQCKFYENYFSELKQAYTDSNRISVFKQIIYPFLNTVWNIHTNPAFSGSFSDFNNYYFGKYGTLKIQNYANKEFPTIAPHENITDLFTSDDLNEYKSAVLIKSYYNDIDTYSSALFNELISNMEIQEVEQIRKISDYYYSKALLAIPKNGYLNDNMNYHGYVSNYQLAYKSTTDLTKIDTDGAWKYQFLQRFIQLSLNNKISGNYRYNYDFVIDQTIYQDLLQKHISKSELLSSQQCLSTYGLYNIPYNTYNDLYSYFMNYIENSYNVLEMTTDEIDTEINKLMINMPQIFKMTNFKIYSYKQDIYNNHYILFKHYQYDKFEDSGEIWIRYKNTPLAMPFMKAIDFADSNNSYYNINNINIGVDLFLTNYDQVICQHPIYTKIIKQIMNNAISFEIYDDICIVLGYTNFVKYKEIFKNSELQYLKLVIFKIYENNDKLYIDSSSIRFITTHEDNDYLLSINQYVGIYKEENADKITVILYNTNQNILNIKDYKRVNQISQDNYECLQSVPLTFTYITYDINNYLLDYNDHTYSNMKYPIIGLYKQQTCINTNAATSSITCFNLQISQEQHSIWKIDSSNQTLAIGYESISKDILSDITDQPILLSTFSNILKIEDKYIDILNIKCNIIYKNILNTLLPVINSFNISLGKDTLYDTLDLSIISGSNTELNGIHQLYPKCSLTNNREITIKLIPTRLGGIKNYSDDITYDIGGLSTMIDLIHDDQLYPNKGNGIQKIFNYTNEHSLISSYSIPNFRYGLKELVYDLKNYELSYMTNLTDISVEGILRQIYNTSKISRYSTNTGLQVNLNIDSDFNPQSYRVAADLVRFLPGIANCILDDMKIIINFGNLTPEIKQFLTGSESFDLDISLYLDDAEINGTEHFKKVGWNCGYTETDYIKWQTGDNRHSGPQILTVHLKKYYNYLFKKYQNNHKYDESIFLQKEFIKHAKDVKLVLNVCWFNESRVIAYNPNIQVIWNGIYYKKSLEHETINFNIGCCENSFQQILHLDLVNNTFCFNAKPYYTVQTIYNTKTHIVNYIYEKHYLLDNQNLRKEHANEIINNQLNYFETCNIIEQLAQFIQKDHVITAQNLINIKTNTVETKTYKDVLNHITTNEKFYIIYRTWYIDNIEGVINGKANIQLMQEDIKQYFTDCLTYINFYLDYISVYDEKNSVMYQSGTIPWSQLSSYQKQYKKGYYFDNDIETTVKYADGNIFANTPNIVSADFNWQSVQNEVYINSQSSAHVLDDYTLSSNIYRIENKLPGTDYYNEITSSDYSIYLSSTYASIPGMHFYRYFYNAVKVNPNNNYRLSNVIWARDPDETLSSETTLSSLYFKDSNITGFIDTYGQDRTTFLVYDVFDWTRLGIDYNLPQYNVTYKLMLIPYYKVKDKYTFLYQYKKEFMYYYYPGLLTGQPALYSTALTGNRFDICSTYFIGDQIKWDLSTFNDRLATIPANLNQLVSTKIYYYQSQVDNLASYYNTNGICNTNIDATFKKQISLYKKYNDSNSLYKVGIINCYAIYKAIKCTFDNQQTEYILPYEKKQQFSYNITLSITTGMINNYNYYSRSQNDIKFSKYPNLSSGTLDDLSTAITSAINWSK